MSFTTNGMVGEFEPTDIPALNHYSKCKENPCWLATGIKDEASLYETWVPSIRGPLDWGREKKQLPRCIVFIVRVCIIGCLGNVDSFRRNRTFSLLLGYIWGMLFVKPLLSSFCMRKFLRKAIHIKRKRLERGILCTVVIMKRAGLYLPQGLFMAAIRAYLGASPYNPR